MSCAVSQEGLERALAARRVRTTRTAHGLSQTAFARRFHVPVGTLLDWEQARVMPPAYAIAYIKLLAAARKLLVLADALLSGNGLWQPTPPHDA